MKCKEKDCNGCVHFINLKTHPLFEDFSIVDFSGREIKYEGCVFHLEVLFLRQIWVALGGVQKAVETERNVTAESALKLLRQVANIKQLR